jgi:uncharacterized protein YhaN
MLRICLIVAILAGLAAGAISFFKVQDIIVTTRAERDDWHKKDDQEVAAHNKTKKNLAETKATLEKTQKDLAQTKSDLDAATAKVEDLNAKNTDLTAKLDKTTAERDDAQQQLEAWRGTGLKPDEVKQMIVDLKNTMKAKDALTSQNKLLATQVMDWSNRWNDFFHGDTDVPLPPGLRGKVVAVDPKFGFVVLDIGTDQGVLARGVMMVDRDGKLLGKVRIKNVGKDRCVANILPNWKRGDIMEGDEVLY